jgi:hypothetical protein
MSSYIPQDEKYFFFAESNHQPHYMRYHYTTASLKTTSFFNIYTTISEKMTSQNKLG